VTDVFKAEHKCVHTADEAELENVHVCAYPLKGWNTSGGIFWPNS